MASTPLDHVVFKELSDKEMDLKTHEIVSEMFAFKKHLAKEVGGGREGGGGDLKA